MTRGTEITVRILEDPDSARLGSTGPVKSIQAAELGVPERQLSELWRPASLERLARSYWHFLKRRSLGLISVRYSEEARTVRLFGLIPLLRFHAPEFETDSDFGRVTWPIDRGFLVASAGRGRGHLRIEVHRCEPGEEDEAGRARVQVHAEVSNYHPFLRGTGRFARIGSFVYGQTQMRLHVLITRGFLRSLATAELPPLRPGRESAYELEPPAGE